MEYRPPKHEGLCILYQDDFMLVLDKPSGLLSVPGRGEDKQDCLASRVQAEFPEALSVHRLDMSTSGLIVMARGADVHRKLSRLFESRQVHKRYVAVVAGWLAQSKGSVALPLITDWPNRPRQKVDFEIGKPSLTHYQLISHEGGEPDGRKRSRVELEPVTGRSHQLRVHMCELGHPIMGDELYGGERTAVEETGRLLLHACWLELPHPISGELVTVQSPAPF
jgi:tRNA pseudouridine32 synthase/23S rRNA pseudouridine746 synthase